MFVLVRLNSLGVVCVTVRSASERIPEHLRERFKFHIQQLPKVVQEILKYVSSAALSTQCRPFVCFYGLMTLKQNSIKQLKLL